MKKIRTKMITILSLSSIALGLGLGVIFMLTSALTMQEAKKDELVWMARSYASKISQDFQIIEDQVEELKIYAENLIDSTRIFSDKGYLKFIEPSLDSYVKLFAQNRALGHSGWIYFEPELSDTPQDVYYIDANLDGVPERQAHIPFEYYDNTPMPDDDKFWFYGPKEQGQGVWTNPYKWELIDGTIINVISYAEPIYVDGRFIGVVGAYFPFDDISNIIKDVRVFETGYAMLFNEKLDVIIHPDYFAGTRYTSDNMHSMANGAYAALANKIDSSEFGVNEFETEADTKIFAYATLSNGWVLGLEPVTKEIYSDIYRILFVILGVIVIFTTAVGAGANFWGRKLTRPIEELTSATQKAAQGDTKVRVKFKSNDEMDILGAAFNNMLDNNQRLREQLERLAFYDEMTGLRNLAKFKIDAKEILENNPDKHFIAIKVDIDGFKLYNQMFGFTRGDILLRGLALASMAILNKKYELCAHVTADEFIFLLRYVGVEDIDNRRVDFFEKINQFCDLGGFKLLLPTGRYVIPMGSTDIIAAFECVNLAHRSSKTMPAPKICDYSFELSEQSLREHELELVQEQALDKGEYIMYLQPKFSLKSRKVVGAEALVRWRQSDGTLIFPSEFIPVFEKNGFITRLDMYMLKLACIAIRGWLDSKYEPVVISINFSRLHFTNPEFIKEVCRIADEYNVPHSLIEIELTETAIFENMDDFQRFMAQAHSASFRVSMDDFGTGYSSLGLLKDLAVDTIKLDKSFFVTSGSRERERAVITSVIDMAHKLNIETVAEGVEDLQHVEFLTNIGCDIVQGYYFERPMPSEAYEDLYYRNT